MEHGNIVRLIIKRTIDKVNLLQQRTMIQKIVANSSEVLVVKSECQPLEFQSIYL